MRATGRKQFDKQYQQDYNATMAMMNKSTASYLAGLLDGEGCFSIWYKTGGYYGNKRIFDCVIRVGMTDKKTIEWLRDSFGGSMSTMSKPGNGLHRKQAYQWALRAKPQMREFIRLVSPYLRIKKRNAEILLQHLNTYGKKENYKHGMMMTDKTFQKRMELLLEMRSLNEKGIQMSNVQRERLSELTGISPRSDSPTLPVMGE